MGEKWEAAVRFFNPLEIKSIQEEENALVKLHIRLQRIDISMLSVAIHEHSMSLHVFRSLLYFFNWHFIICGIKVLYIHIFRFSPKFWWVFFSWEDFGWLVYCILILAYTCLWLEYRIRVDFLCWSCILRLYWTNLLILGEFCWYGILYSSHLQIEVVFFLSYLYTIYFLFLSYCTGYNFQDYAE